MLQFNDWELLKHAAIRARPRAALAMPATVPQYARDPRNRGEMLASPMRAGFMQGEVDELSNLQLLGFADLIDDAELLPTDKIIDSTWAYRGKRNPATGEIVRYRSRFCTRGDQKDDVPLKFAPIPRMSSVKYASSAWHKLSYYDRVMFDEPLLKSRSRANIARAPQWILLVPVVAPPHIVARVERAHDLGAGLGFRVCGFGFRVSGFGFRGSGFGFRV